MNLARTDFEQQAVQALWQPGQTFNNNVVQRSGALWLPELPDYIALWLPGEFFWNTSLKRIIFESCSNFHIFFTYSVHIPPSHQQRQVTLETWDCVGSNPRGQSRLLMHPAISADKNSWPTNSLFWTNFLALKLILPKGPSQFSEFVKDEECRNVYVFEYRFR